jgi:putative oxidoreductase
MSIGRLAARVVIGGLFLGHGTQKLFGWFGGPGLDGTTGMMGSLELQPAKVNALAAGLTETVGGAMVAAGAATPLAAATLTGTMTTAIRTVHLKNGPWVTNGGFEYNLVLIAALLGLVDGGPGELSVDGALGIDDTDYRWALAALALGVTSSIVTTSLARRAARSADPYPSAADESSDVNAAEAAEPPSSSPATS